MTYRRLVCLSILVTAFLVVGAGPASAQGGGYAPGAPGRGDPYFPLEGNGGYDVQHYDLSFSYDPATDRLDALNKITAKATQNLSRFDLDLQQLTVKGVEVNDPPSDKATWTFRVTVPAGLEVIANGRLVSHKEANGKSTWVWDERYPMSNYLATADIGQWEFKNGTTPGGIPETVALDPTLRQCNPAAMDFFYDTTAEATDLWNDTFGPYPFDSTGAIADNATYNGQSIGFSLETQTRPLYSAVRSTSTIAHELAHQWFGDAVAVRTWQHIWLNEGFASFAQYLWNEHLGVRTGHQDFLLDYSRPASDPFWQIIVADPQRDTMFARAVYRRGAMTLQALREKIGDGPFFQILRTWVAEHLHGTATTEEFIALSERISDRDLSS